MNQCGCISCLQMVIILIGRFIHSNWLNILVNVLNIILHSNIYWTSTKCTLVSLFNVANFSKYSYLLHIFLMSPFLLIHTKFLPPPRRPLHILSPLSWILINVSVWPIPCPSILSLNVTSSETSRSLYKVSRVHFL